MDEMNETTSEETEELIDTEQEHLTEDGDADTSDVEEAANEDEEQEVEASDADTNDVMSFLEQLSGDISSLRAQVISMKDMFSQFVDAGGVVREEDNIPADDVANDTIDYVPIEELDLTI